MLLGHCRQCAFTIEDNALSSYEVKDKSAFIWACCYTTGKRHLLLRSTDKYFTLWTRPNASVSCSERFNVAYKNAQSVSRWTLASLLTKELNLFVSQCSFCIRIHIILLPSCVSFKGGTLHERLLSGAVELCRMFSSSKVCVDILSGKCVLYGV